METNKQNIMPFDLKYISKSDMKIYVVFFAALVAFEGGEGGRDKN